MRTIISLDTERSKTITWGIWFILGDEILIHKALLECATTLHDADGFESVICILNLYIINSIQIYGHTLHLQEKILEHSLSMYSTEPSLKSYNFWRLSHKTKNSN